MTRPRAKDYKINPPFITVSSESILPDNYASLSQQTWAARVQETFIPFINEFKIEHLAPLNKNNQQYSVGIDIKGYDQRQLGHPIICCGTRSLMPTTETYTQRFMKTFNRAVVGILNKPALINKVTVQFSISTVTFLNPALPAAKKRSLPQDEEKSEHKVEEASKRFCAEVAVATSSAAPSAASSSAFIDIYSIKPVTLKFSYNHLPIELQTLSEPDWEKAIIKFLQCDAAVVLRYYINSDLVRRPDLQFQIQSPDAPLCTKIPAQSLQVAAAAPILIDSQLYQLTRYWLELHRSSGAYPGKIFLKYAFMAHGEASLEFPVESLNVRAAYSATRYGLFACLNPAIPLSKKLVIEPEFAQLAEQAAGQCSLLKWQLQGVLLGRYISVKNLIEMLLDHSRTNYFACTSSTQKLNFMWSCMLNDGNLKEIKAQMHSLQAPFLLTVEPAMQELAAKLAEGNEELQWQLQGLLLARYKNVEAWKELLKTKLNPGCDPRFFDVHQLWVETMRYDLKLASLLRYVQPNTVRSAMALGEFVTEPAIACLSHR